MANVQNAPAAHGMQATQNNHNTQNITINNHNVSPDETGYTMPPDPGAPANSTWIYGDPNLTLSLIHI